MRRLLGILTICGMLLGLSTLGAASVLTQGSRVTGCRYFPGTGHNVQSEFLTFFDRYGGTAIFGQPRTEAFLQDGLTVQYFERARMELHPSNPSQYRVQLALLGDLLGYRQPAIPARSIPPFNHPQRRYYPQTGHTLSYVFLQYYDARGGLDVFGYPISEMIAQDGLVVQYFQRGKMEWHPENPISSQVTLGSLGNEYILRTKMSQQYLARVASLCGSTPTSPAAASPPVSALVPQPTTPSSRPSSVSPQVESTPIARATQPPPPGPQPTPVRPRSTTTTDFSVSPTVKYRTAGQGGPQTIYVRAVDTQGRGVSNASVEAIIHFQDEDVSVPGTTDGSGFCSLSFTIGFPPPGYTVMIEVRVTHAGRTVTTSTSFMIW